MTEWKSIPGFSNYEASEHGEIRSLARVIVEKSGKRRKSKTKVMKQYLTHDGYNRIRLVNDAGKVKQMRVHRLVLLAFHGPPPQRDWHGAHLQGGKEDNSIHNLQWQPPEMNLLERNERVHRPLTYFIEDHIRPVEGFE